MRASLLVWMPLGLLVLAASANAATPVDWNAVSDVGTIHIVTTNEDGTPRTTRIWLVVWQGNGYIRTGRTRWRADIERNPDVVIRIDEDEHPLRATEITDPETREAIAKVFREKYGFSDQLTGLYRGLGGPPVILRLDPR
jgi:hypothetical protein